MFAVFDCTCLWVRKKEDPFNAIMAGAATGGFLQLRSGIRPAFRSAVFGGVLLAIIEGLGIGLQKMTSPPPPASPFQPGRLLFVEKRGRNFGAVHTCCSLVNVAIHSVVPVNANHAIVQPLHVLA